MQKELPEVNFKNQDNPKSYFDIVKIEDLLKRDLNHDISENHLVKFYIILFVYEGEGYHTIDFNRVFEERQNFDPVGHYSRPDVTQLSVNRQRQ